MTMSKPQTDIFGEPQTGPDLSTEALNWEPVEEFGDGGDDESLSTSEEGSDTNSGTEDEGAEGDEENGTDTPAETTTENAETELPDEFRGKTPAELVKMIQDSQGFISKQGNDIGELRKAIEQVQAAQQQAVQPELAPASDYIENVQDGLLAYREAIQMLDRQEIGPAAIDDIIDVVRDLDPTTAAKMDRDFGMRLARAEMQQQMQPVIQQSYNDALTQATQHVNRDPDAEAYRTEIVRIVQEPKTLVEHQVQIAYNQARTAPEIASALQSALQVARGADPVKSVAYKQHMNSTKQDEAVEHGNAAPAAKSMTETERLISNLLQPADPAADLFANFGG